MNWNEKNDLNSDKVFGAYKKENDSTIDLRNS